MRFLFLRGQADNVGLGVIRFALHTLQEPLPLPRTRRGSSTALLEFVRIVNGITIPIRAVSVGGFSFFIGEFPTHQARMTEVYLRVGQAGTARFSRSRFFLLPKCRKALRIYQKSKGEQTMKYRAVWKPGGRPRRGMGSMKSGRRQLQALKPKGMIPGKGVKSFGESGARTAA